MCSDHSFVFLLWLQQFAKSMKCDNFIFETGFFDVAQDCVVIKVRSMYLVIWILWTQNDNNDSNKIRSSNPTLDELVFIPDPFRTIFFPLIFPIWIHFIHEILNLIVLWGSCFQTKATLEKFQFVGTRTIFSSATIVERKLYTYLNNEKKTPTLAHSFPYCVFLFHATMV